jgi:hypothetical protein
MDRILVSRLPYGSSYSLYLNVYLVFNVSWFLSSLQHWWFFLSLLKPACQYHRQQTHTGCFRSVFNIRRRPLPRVKVVTFLRDMYKSVMSTSRQTNGAHGCLMPPQKVRFHLKMEQLFAGRPWIGLVLTYKHQTLHLAWARIHLRFTRAWGHLVVGRGCIWFESSSKQLRLCQKKCYPPFSQHWQSGKQCATSMTAVSRYVRLIFRDTFVYETALCGCY